MSKVQLAKETAANQPAKRMYRGIVTAQAVADVFVRATSDAAANAAIAAGKGQRMKPRFTAWKLCREAIAVDGYAASTIPASEIPHIIGLAESELGKVYVQVLHRISLTRVSTAYTDADRQAMTEAVREFYDLLTEAIRAKGSQQGNQFT
jgi:hypothetical protein